MLQQIFLPNVTFGLPMIWEVAIVLAIWLLSKRLKVLPPAEGTSWTGKLWVRTERHRLVMILALGVTCIGGWSAGIPLPTIQIAAILAVVWLVIDILHLWLHGFWARTALIAGYTITLTYLLIWFDQPTDIIGSLRINVGSLTISFYGLLKGLLVLLITLWFAMGLTRLIEKHITASKFLSLTAQVLVIKFVKIALLVVVVLVSLQSMGIDLTSLAVFGGALGLGLGFGLQHVVSNFISGFILLTDRSIKPGDVVEIDNTYGWINKLGARFVSVITRDGKEHLIPNEVLITQRVINWSFSSDDVRIRVPVGISYQSDPRRAIELVIEAASECPRILKTPAPNCLLIRFGESSLDLEARVWIRDPFNGLRNIQSDLLLRIWDKFKAHNIEIPFPQRDVHIIPPDNENR